MDRMHYKEMTESIERMVQEKAIQGKQIFLFGHCNATEELADWLLEVGFPIEAILDNNRDKHGNRYRGIEIRPPQAVLECPAGQGLVCIAARAYAAMADQLKRIGYKGSVRKVVDYNSYAEYSLSEDTIARRQERVKRGIRLLRGLEERHPGCYKILCPFSALGDIYFTMSYLPYFMKKKGIEKCMVGVIGKACEETVRLFGSYEVESLVQKDMDEIVQAALYTEDRNVFIPHQDRPYVVALSKALHICKIPLERLYCCGVFSLAPGTPPYRPVRLQAYGGLGRIQAGKSVIFSPYAKSVTAIRNEVWEQVVGAFRDQGYSCYTNVAGEERPLPGTLPISPSIPEVQSVVERAGTFVGIRSGLCDVIREASCRKIALYPDYHYCGTRWKAIDMYRIEGWENIVVEEGFQWKMS